MAPNVLTANWHTHNFRCRHASGDFSDYFQSARHAGLSVLGISDHSPTPDDRDGGCRMLREELPGYVDGFRVARAAFPDMALHLGVELEYYQDILPGYADELWALGIEYLVGAPHFFAMPDGTVVSSWSKASPNDQPRLALAYGDFVAGMVSSGLYAFIAHPDLLGCFCDRWLPECEEAARRIASAAREAGVPLEINTYGFAKPWKADADTGALRPQYPWEPFWKTVAEERATVMVNSDAHAPEAIVQHFDDALALCARCGLTPTVFTRLERHRLA